MINMNETVKICDENGFILYATRVPGGLLYTSKKRGGDPTSSFFVQAPMREIEEVFKRSVVC